MQHISEFKYKTVTQPPQGMCSIRQPPFSCPVVIAETFKNSRQRRETVTNCCLGRVTQCYVNLSTTSWPKTTSLTRKIYLFNEPRRNNVISVLIVCFGTEQNVSRPQPIESKPFGRRSANQVLVTSPRLRPHLFLKFSSHYGGSSRV